MTTDEGRVRSWLAGRLKMRDVPAATWQRLVDRRYVAEVLQDEEGAREQLVDEARDDLLRRGRPKHPGRSRPRRPADLVHLTRAERESAATFAACLANQIARTEQVQRFRKCYLGGRLLPEREARRLLDLRAGVERWSGRFGGGFKRALYEVADWLCARYPWERNEAEMLVLSGKAPSVAPLQIQGQLGGAGPVFGPLAPITIAAMPFVSAKTVERTYRNVQRLVRRGDNRLVGTRQLALMQFVTRRQANGGQPKWEAWRLDWNRDYRKRPAWRFEDRSAFRRAFQRARELFVPRYLDMDTMLPSAPPG